jgi:hypothetical protein
MSVALAITLVAAEAQELPLTFTFSETLSAPEMVELYQQLEKDIKSEIFVTEGKVKVFSADAFAFLAALPEGKFAFGNQRVTLQWNEAIHVKVEPLK